MELFLQQIITGVSIGGIYALLAVGYALIYSVFDFSNFAFGCIMMVSAFTCYYCTQAGMGLAISLVLSLMAGIALSLVIELVAYRPLRRRGTDRLFLMITGMGIDLAVTNTATVTLGANARAIKIQEFNMDAFQFGNIYLSKLDVVALVVSLTALLFLYLYINHTKTGLGIRAAAYSTSTAGLMGINVNKVSLSIFFMAGIAGVFCGMKYAVNPAVGSIPATKAFIASVIGGLGSLPGAVIGGLVLGIVETLASGFISSVYRDLFSYGILIFVLLFMPQGLLGRQASEKL